MKESFNEIPVWANIPARNPRLQDQVEIPVDRGPVPFIVDIEEVTIGNKNFRTTLWTGEYLQLTVMSIDVGDDVGLEKHTGVDQFLRIEEGEALVLMGDSEDNLSFRQRASADDVIIVPSGKWHNIINIGRRPLKLYSIYAPPEHPKGTIHVTKADE